MFECSIEGLLLKRLVECLKDMCADASFVCKADGISLIAMDGSHVAVVNLNLDLDLFHKYRCDRPVELGLSIPNLLLALQPVKTAETLVHLSSLHGADADEEDDVVLHVNIEEPGTGDSWSMELRLLDIEAEPLTVPQEEHEAVAVVSSKELQDLIRYLNSFCESVVVRMEKSCMKLSARGDSLAASRKLHVDNMTCSAATEQEFAARYLNIFMKGAALSDSVEIACSRGQPMRVLFALGLHADSEREGGKRKGGGGGSDKHHHHDVKMEEEGNGVAGASNRSSFLAFYLAPRLDEAEE